MIALALSAGIYRKCHRTRNTTLSESELQFESLQVCEVASSIERLSAHRYMSSAYQAVSNTCIDKI
jgi:hypothetical protein